MREIETIRMHATTVTAPAPEPESALTTVRRHGRLVIVGGVPGAGKSTLLEWAGREAAHARMLDPERHRRRLAQVLPRGVPYRSYRALVHALHTLATVGCILLGPVDSGAAGVLVVHSTATRPRRREWLARLARLRGWEPILLMVDVGRQTALAGQHERGRVVDAESFSRHWSRWTRQRGDLVEAQRASTPMGSWAKVEVADRDTARARLMELLS